jgi:hypothetical protein
MARSKTEKRLKVLTSLKCMEMIEVTRLDDTHAQIRRIQGRIKDSSSSGTRDGKQS